MAVSRTDIDPIRATAPIAQPLGMRVAWGGVWTGLLVAIGVMLLLSVLGLAIGVSAADIGPGEDGNAKGLGIGAAIWSSASLLIALFVGGMMATRTGAIDEGTGMIEGALIWVLSTLALIYMAASGIGMLGSGVFGTLGGVTQGAAAAVRNIDVTEITAGNVDQITSRLNDRSTIQLVAAATGMPRQEARSMLAGIAKRVEDARNDPAQATAEARRGLEELASRTGTRVEQAAADAQPYASATMWSTLAAMLLALVAAIGGAMVGRKQMVRHVAAFSSSERVLN
jgi:hypothetical protein